jgi:tRNA-specific 2-thiouridylase
MTPQPQINTNDNAAGKRRVMVGLSGGVDSSVSAALLKKEGYDVIGVFIKVWQPDFLPCSWRDERRDAMRVAAYLEIPFLTLDLTEVYKKEVVDYMIREYQEGAIPNPDVMCNQHVKFGAFLDFARTHNASFVATGHYAQIKVTDGHSSLYAGRDLQKDQSYFLWTLTEAQRAQILFPVGHLEKSEVRQIARELGLPTAEKKDSQGLCFMGAVNMKEFLSHYTETKRGDVCDQSGRVIGHHDGALFYTIGQRHGFHVEAQHAHTAALYVTGKDMQANTITVSPQMASGNVASAYSIDRVGGSDSADSSGSLNSSDSSDNSDSAHSCRVESVNWISAHTPPHIAGIYARIRYRGELHPVTLTESDTKAMFCAFQSPHNDYIARGQSIVFYKDDECLGGGVIQY